MVEVTKHFKLIGVLVMAFLAIVIIYGWNRAENTKNIPVQTQPQQKQVGNHPNLVQPKKPCNVCEAKRKQQQMQQGLRQSTWT